MSDRKKLFASHFKTDLSAGLVVFLIALPLCLGISMMSGAPLFSGIIAGIVGGIVVGLLSGSNINVSGPAASVALIIVTGIEVLGSFQAVLPAIVIAGVFQIILGFLKAGTIAYFFPNSLIKAILASIGLMLILKQIPHAFGIDGVFEGSESFEQNDGRNTFNEIMYAIGEFHYGAIIITLISLAIILIWERPFLKRYAFFQLFPSALAAVLVSILVNEFFKQTNPTLALGVGHLVTLEISNSIGDFFSFFSLPDFKFFLNSSTYSIGLSIALVASLETLLSTEAGDKLDPYKRKTSTNRELFAQGGGNIVAGMIGGLPITAVIVRTSANVNAGGRTKTATIIHGILMLLCVALIPTLLNLIPYASLAAVLFVIGAKLTSYSIFKSVYKQGSKQFIPFVITILVVIFSDLITGIMVGGTISVFFILRDNYKNAYLHDKVAHDGNEKTIIKLAQETTFLNKADIMLFINHLPENHHLIIDGTDAKFIHPDIFEIIEDFKVTAKYKNITLELIDLENKSHIRKFWSDLK